MTVEHAQHTVLPRQPEACGTTRGWSQERCPQQPAAQEPHGSRHGQRSGLNEHIAAMLGWSVQQGKEGARDKRREDKQKTMNPLHREEDAPPTEKKKERTPPRKKN